MGKKTVAKLNANGVLIGSRSVDENVEGIEFGDLPTDGRYKWNATKSAFLPVGHDFGKVKTKQPHAEPYVMARLIETLAKLPGYEVPFEAQEWLDWYNTEMRRRDEELASKPR